MTSTSKNEQNRINWVAQKLKALAAGSRLLDAGAGEQQYKKFCTHLTYVSQDFAQYDPKKNEDGLQMPEWNYGKLDLVCDITAIPEPDNSFDAILCTEVFEHIPDPIKAIKEFSRLLKPGGKLILTAPFCSMTHFAPYHFYTGFNRYFYEKILPEYHLNIRSLEYNGNYFEFVAQEVERSAYVANTYNGYKLSLMDKIGLRFAGKFLNKLAATQNNSSELLAFGIHVTAEKKA